MNIKRIKEISKIENKRISKKALSKIAEILEKRAREIVKRAAKNADFAGRATIRAEDVQEFAA